MTVAMTDGPNTIQIEEKQHEMRTDGEPHRQMEADEFGGFATRNEPMTEDPMQGHGVQQRFEPDVVHHAVQQHRGNYGQTNNPGHTSNLGGNNTANVEGTQPAHVGAQQTMFSGYGHVPQRTHSTQAPEGQSNRSYNNTHDIHSGYGPVFSQNNRARQIPYNQ